VTKKPRKKPGPKPRFARWEHIKLRVSPKVHAAVHAAAVESGKSANAWCTDILESVLRARTSIKNA
jgi:predicted HicB family RNase H-like nuclease